MSMGGPGDNPLTDLLRHGRHPFPPDLEAMILKIARLCPPPEKLYDLGWKPFDWEQGQNLDEARTLLGGILSDLNKGP